MKQINARTSRLRSVGGFMFLLKSTLGLFGIALLGISLFGWYELVLWQYVGSLWLFLALLAFLFSGLAALQYFILTPVEFAFIARQSYAHNNPYVDDVRAIRDLLERQFPQGGGRGTGQAEALATSRAVEGLTAVKLAARSDADRTGEEAA